MDLSRRVVEGHELMVKEFINRRQNKTIFVFNFFKVREIKAQNMSKLEEGSIRK